MKGSGTLKIVMNGLVVLGLLADAGCSAGNPALEHSRLIDLTHTFGEDTIVWPTGQEFRLVVQEAGETAGGYYYAPIVWRWPSMAARTWMPPFTLPEENRRWIRCPSSA